MAKLGTHQHPAVVRVRSLEQAEEITAYARERGWQVITGVEPDEVENISDLRKLMRAEGELEDRKPRLPPRISGNDYCPCRSGRKFKKCCGAAMASPGA